MTELARTPFSDEDPLEYKLSKGDDGSRHASNTLFNVTVLNDGENKIFKRRAMKGVGSGETTYDTCLVAELDGVRAYINGNSIVLTKQELYL